jgi:hypothetical protein
MLRLAEVGIRHRRGGYRDPESQAFIENWFRKLKEREVWLNEYETLDARRGIGGYVDRYHHRPHSGLDYRTPDEVRRTWEDQQQRQKQAAQPVNTGEEQVNPLGSNGRARPAGFWVGSEILGMKGELLEPDDPRSQNGP